MGKSVLTSDTFFGKMKMIDTLQITRSLISAGIDRGHAEATTEAIVYAVEQYHHDVATKEFVRNELNVLSARIEALEARLETIEARLTAKMEASEEKMIAKIEASEERMTAKMNAGQAQLLRWIVGTAIAVVGLVFTGIALLV